MLLFSVVFVDFAVVELKAPYTCTFADEAKIETRTACFVPGVSQKYERIGFNVCNTQVPMDQEYIDLALTSLQSIVLHGLIDV